MLDSPLYYEIIYCEITFTREKKYLKEIWSANTATRPWPKNIPVPVSDIATRLQIPFRSTDRTALYTVTFCVSVRESSSKIRGATGHQATDGVQL